MIPTDSSNAARDRFNELIARLRARGSTIQRTARPDQIRATCPAHADRRSSLVVTLGEQKVLLHCFARCRPTAIVHALDLQMSDLFA
ncbi:MAG: hypothetical protein ACRD2A_19065, partial [Vicinamibacterales bacterium]